MYNNKRACDGFGGFTGSTGMAPVGTGLPTAVETMLQTGPNVMPANTGMFHAPNNMMPPGPNMMPTGKGTMPAGTGMVHSGADTLYAGTGMLPVGPATPAGTSMIPAGTGTLPTGPATPASTLPIGGTQPGWTNMPATLESPFFTPGFLRTQIGRRVRVEFLIGTNGTTDRSGTLLAVGSSYIVIQPFESDDMMMCDLFAIKFVTIFL